MNGLEFISSVFAAGRLQHRSVFMPYFTLGFPNEEQSVEVIKTLAKNGADLIELGLPFSDPLADGPTIQHSTTVALENGMTMHRCLELVKRLRSEGVLQPLLLMGYINPILAFGASDFVLAAVQAGADGLIIPDLPPEEAGEIEQACKQQGLALVFLLAPTSTPQRIALVTSKASGFIYLVSVAGVTGARNSLDPGLEDFIHRVRLATDLPLAVGFGISTAEQVKQVSNLADGVIIGSALIRHSETTNQPALSVEHFIKEIFEFTQMSNRTQ